MIDRREWIEKKKKYSLLAMLPLLFVSAAILNFSVCGFIEGFDGPVWQVLLESAESAAGRLSP